MENKLNISELLKDCPKGMELDCTVLEDLEFDGIVDSGYAPIRCRVKNPNGGYYVYNFTKYGCWLNTTFAKCVIFPKGKTTWEGFVPPCKFKEGDIISNDMYIAIFYKADRPYTDCKRDVLYYHCWYNRKYNEFKVETDYGIGRIEGYKLATEEEKQRLFDAIKANGYKWNTETKTLKKLVEPKFKVGDKIKQIGSPRCYIIQSIEFDRYILHNNQFLRFGDEHIYELALDKFDINTLKPFDKVLVRDFDNTPWEIDFFSRLLDGKHFKCVDLSYVQCIPYEENKHLLGTTNDCNDFYKTW